MKSRNSCAAIGCGARIERWQRLCGPCFHVLPGDQRRALATAAAEKRALDRAALVRTAVAWLATHSPAAEAARRLGEAPP